MYVLMYMCVHVSINVIDTSFLYLVHHIGHMCIMCPVRPKIFALARMHRMNIIMPSVVILAWESISHPDLCHSSPMYGAASVATGLLMLCGGGFWSWLPSSPTQGSDQVVECRWVVEGENTVGSEVISVLREQLQRCGPEHLRKEPCPSCHPCPDCPSCPILSHPVSPDQTNLVLIAFVAGLCSGCSSMGCCVRPACSHARRVFSPEVRTERHLHARVEDMDHRMAPQPISGQKALPPPLPGLVPPGQGIGSSSVGRRRISVKRSVLG